MSRGLGDVYKRQCTIVLALTVASASAFVAPRAAAAKTVVAASPYENEVGAQTFWQVGFFDPLGLSDDLSPEVFEQYRTAELKHGRIAQLAVIGYIVPEVFRWPGEIAPGLAFADIPHGFAAVNAIPILGWVQMIFAIGAVDYYGFLGDFDSGKKVVGNMSLEEAQTKELSHGRLAMLAIAELLRHDCQQLYGGMYQEGGFAPLITGLPMLYGN
jgi:hypothetical protein